MMPQQPPSSLMNPSGQSNMQHSQNLNNLSHQMQDMRLVPPATQSAGFSSPINSSKPLPDSNQTSPLHKLPNTTTVTYSNQLNATYPYINNNQAGTPRPNQIENVPRQHSAMHTNGATNGNDTSPNQVNGVHSPQHNHPQVMSQTTGRLPCPTTDAPMRPQGSPYQPQATRQQGPPSSGGLPARPPNPSYMASSSPNMLPASGPQQPFSPITPNNQQLAPGASLTFPSNQAVQSNQNMNLPARPLNPGLYGSPNMPQVTGPPNATSYPGSNMPFAPGPPNSNAMHQGVRPPLSSNMSSAGPPNLSPIHQGAGSVPSSSMPLSGPPNVNTMYAGSGQPHSSNMSFSGSPNVNAMLPGSVPPFSSGMPSAARSPNMSSMPPVARPPLSPNMPFSGPQNAMAPGYGPPNMGSMNPGVGPNPNLPPQPGFQQYGSQPFPGNYPTSPMPPGGMPLQSQPHYAGTPSSPGTQPYPYQAGGSGGNSYPYGASSPTQNKLSLDQMPSAVTVREEDKRLYAGRPYLTNVKAEMPPLVSTNFIAQDKGMCSPRFIRSSLYCLPNNPDVLKQTALPFAITISPLASVEEGETEPPTCIYREEGPLRCKRCKAYICPFMTFMEGGRCFQCAFCKVVTEVPQDYFCFLDGMGERTDKYYRPELCLGSYEYIATKDYCRKEELPNPPAYIFMIEVSHATFRNGLIPLLCENMKSVLQCLMNDESNDRSKLRVGFVTYNNVLHFYNLKKNLTQPHIMVLSDVHNAFVPLLDGFLVTLSEAEALVDSLMEHIPRLFMNEPATEIILGPVIQVGLEALKNANCSGKLLVFHSTIPNADAPGKLPHREGQKLLGTEKQKIALSPQTDFYSKLAQDCVAAGCAVDLYLFPNAYVDVASLGPLIRHTGGQMYKYTYFQSPVDGDRFLEDLEKSLTMTTAFDAVLRVRTSAGISPVFYYGNFYMSNSTDVELSCIDGHKSVTVEFAYDDKIPENETVFMQAALLYTTCTGERRIRVHNLALPTSVGMPDIYKGAELDTIVNFLAKQALKQLYDHSPQQITNALVSRSVKILTCYRKNCVSSGSGAGQLILPETLKLLPIYSNCLLRSDAIGGGADMTLDDRSFAMLSVNSMSVKSTSFYFYPNLIPLHEMNLESTEMPAPVRCSIEKMSDSGAYLLENGIHMFLWIGQAINPDWLDKVFGVQSTHQIEKQKNSLPELENPLSLKIRGFIENLEEERQWCMKLSIMVQGDKLEIVFRQFLVEDKGANNSLSSTDFMVHLHNEITKNA